MELSKKMSETMQVLEKYKVLIRYEGGFWSWEDTDMEPLHNGGQFLCMVPSWYCDVKTLRALAKRDLVVLNETSKVCRIKNEQKKEDE